MELDITCVVCGQNMNHMHEDARHVHVNGCLDRKKRKSNLFKSADDSDDNIFDIKPTKKRMINTKLTSKPKGKTKTTSKTPNVGKTSTKSEKIQSSDPPAGPACSEMTNISDVDEQLYRCRMRIGEIEAQIAELQADRVSLVKSMRKLHRKQLLAQAPLETSETTDVLEVAKRIFKRRALPSVSMTSDSSWWQLNQQLEEFDQTVEKVVNVDSLLSPRTSSDMETSDIASNGILRRENNSDYLNDAQVSHHASPNGDNIATPDLLLDLFTKLSSCVHRLPRNHHKFLNVELESMCQRGFNICKELRRGEGEKELRAVERNEADAIAGATSEPPSLYAVQKACDNIGDETVVRVRHSFLDFNAAPSSDTSSQESTHSCPIKTAAFNIDLSGLIASSPPPCSNRESMFSSGRTRNRLSLSDVFETQEKSSVPIVSQFDGASPLTPERSSFEDNQENYIFHYSPSCCDHENYPSPAPLISCRNCGDNAVQLSAESPSDKENDAQLHAKKACCASGGEFIQDLKSYANEDELLQLSTPVLETLCSTYGLKTTNRDIMQNALGSLWRRLKNVSRTQTECAAAPSSHKVKSPITLEDVTECLKSQKDIYEKIVSFVPIEVSDVQGRLASKGFTVSAQTLRDMLDSLGVFVAVWQGSK